MDENLEDEDELNEFKSVVIDNISLFFKAPNKMQLIGDSLRQARDVVVADFESSSDEDERLRSVTVFFNDSDQKRENQLKVAVA